MFCDRGRSDGILLEMAKVSKDDVLKLAKLSRLKLTDKEVDQFANEFSEILGYVEQLKNADTEGLKPTYQVSGLSTVTRSDELIDYKTTQEELLKNVPEVKDKQIQIKRMLG